MVTATLADHPAIDIVGEAANGEEAIERAVELEPDVVLMDVEMPVLGGIEATRRLCARLHETRVVAFAGSGDSDVVMAMIAAGATAYCAKSAGVWELERAIVTPPRIRWYGSRGQSRAHRPRRRSSIWSAASCAGSPVPGR